jgi:hypothetical protein
MKPKILFIVLFLLSQIACVTTGIVETTPRSEIVLYQQAIAEAMSPDSSKICFDLVPINKKNNKLIWKTIGGEEYLLVVTWKQNVNYYKPYLDSAFYNTRSYPIWVTTAPQLNERMKNENANDVDLRLKQLLGLPPNSVYSYFVEFWVKPEDLFRPCPDDEISDKSCSLCFPPNTDSTHIIWINSNRIDRYYQCDLYSNYPWSQLGYTYDWNPDNKTHVGLSEFVIDANKNIVVKAIYTTSEYLSKDGLQFSH